MNKNKQNTTQKGKVSRQQLRKEKRKEKKLRRNDYNLKKAKRGFARMEIAAIAEKLINETKHLDKKSSSKNKNAGRQLNNSHFNKIPTIEEANKREKIEQKKLQRGMSKQRKQQLLKENEKEDKMIRKLEKQLKLHNRKTKAIPKSFATDGLDYLLEVCDSEFMKNATVVEQDLHDNIDHFEEDFDLMSGRKSQEKSENENSESENDVSDGDASGSFQHYFNEEDSENDKSLNGDMENDESEIESEDETNTEDDSDSLGYSPTFDKNTSTKNGNGDDVSSKINKRKIKSSATESTRQPKRMKLLDANNDDSDQSIYANSATEDLIKSKKMKLLQACNHDSHQPSDTEQSKSEDRKINTDHDDTTAPEEDKGVWEDIYGRLRSKNGEILQEIIKTGSNGGKYVPPAVRDKLASAGSEDKKQDLKHSRLKRHLKGLLNRLAESNMHNIANQLEQLYMNYSRNIMNESLTELTLEPLVSSVITPERLLMEHVLLIAVLHANVGTEVGAHFLLTAIKKFDTLLKSNQNIEDKSLDNIINVLAQLYNFKVFDAKLLFEILQQLSAHFVEKNVDCILLVLRSVGFNLRKEDPLGLKNLILELQRQAASASKGTISNSRVKFLLDILLAIKNNNVSKIPNYDITYSEHLKKIMKGFIRKGNYVTTLNICLEDLLKAEERGKWWVVGSAWTGKTENLPKKQEKFQLEGFSERLLDLARKQRMNTDTRRNIFCVLMSADDYLDAFEKLLRLGLKNQQEREIIHVIVHCCLQEKTFNPFYAVLAQRFCEYDRRFQMTIKCCAWDKLKTLSRHSGQQISNLAKLLTHLFIHKGLPISTLKIVEFSELDKVTSRLIRQILLGVLLHEDLENVQAVFSNVALSDKLKMFRESLRLFIHHFLLRNLKYGVLSDDQKSNLEIRAKMVEKILIAKESRHSW